MKRIYGRGKYVGRIRKFKEYNKEGRRVRERKI